MSKTYSSEVFPPLLMNKSYSPKVFALLLMSKSYSSKVFALLFISKSYSANVFTLFGDHKSHSTKVFALFGDHKSSSTKVFVVWDMGVWGIVLRASSFEIGEHWHTEDADVMGHMQNMCLLYILLSNLIKLCCCKIFTGRTYGAWGEVGIGLLPTELLLWSTDSYHD